MRRYKLRTQGFKGGSRKQRGAGRKGEQEGEEDRRLNRE
jgi:hypothetical protein